MSQTRSIERRVGAETCVSVNEMLNARGEDVREKFIHSPIHPVNAVHGAILSSSVVYHPLLNYICFVMSDKGGIAG